MNRDTPKRILILGGGFAGLYAAMRLEKTLAADPDIDITLVNRENFFLFTPMLHEVAASDLDLTTIVNPVRKMLHRVNFVAGEVESMDLPNRRVVVSHGFDHHRHSLEYDYVVLGLGSTTLGQLAAIGKRTGVANILGVNFSGFIAWWLWRTIYLSKLPRFEKKVRVALDWSLDLVFSKDLVQFLTVRAPSVSRADEASVASAVSEAVSRLG